MTADIRAKKSLGQNFLKDPYYLSKITDAGQLGPDDQVLEIGPGLGHLTHLLAQRAKKVLALELDDRLIPYLEKEFEAFRNVEIVQTDALKYAYEKLPGTWKVLANLPYYISTPIIQKLIGCHSKFSKLILLLQKEVAERIAALPGGKEYGYLSVLVQLYTVPSIEFLVPSGAFTPKPKVDSSVISLTVRDRPRVSISDEDYFFRLIKAAFSQRRKTLRNGLKQLNIPTRKMNNIAAGTGIDLTRRAETLSVEEFARLADFLRS